MNSRWSVLQEQAQALVGSLDLMLDTHVHIGQWEHEAYRSQSAGWAETVEVLQSCGFHGMVVMPVGAHANQSLYDEMVQGPEFPAWLFPWVAPSVPESEAFVEAHQSMVAGIKIHPSFDRCRITDPAFVPILDKAQQHGWPVQVHCGRWQEMASYKWVLEIAERYPEVRFICAHLGGDLPELRLAAVRGAEERGLPNIYFDMSTTREFYVIRSLVDAFGWNRLLFGSDFNLHHPLTLMATLVASGIPPEALVDIMGGNLKKLMEGRPLFFERRSQS